MTTAHRTLVAGIFFTFLSYAAYADPPKDWKAHELSPAEEKRWIDAVKNHKTSDGATVMEVLKYPKKCGPSGSNSQRYKLVTIIPASRMKL